VDGDIHDLQQEEDARQEKVLSALGLRIVRFRNDEIVMTRSSPQWWGESKSNLSLTFQISHDISSSDISKIDIIYDT